MNQALAYVVVSVVLAAIMYWAKSKEHAVTNEGDVFRYPPRLLQALYACCIIPIALAGFVCVVSTPDFDFVSSVSLMALGAIGSVLIYVFCVHVKQFSVAISNSDMTVTSAKGSESIRFSDIGNVINFRGIRGSYVRLYINGRSKPLTLYDSLGDFDQLADLIRSGVEASGGSYQRIDTT